MEQLVIGLVAPGAMGSAVGASFAASGVPVLWAEDGRSGATRQRAEADGLEAVADLPTLVARVSVVVSVCPPHAAIGVADEVAALGFDGIYLDANAVAPATALEIADRLAPATFVDGSLIGPPPRAPGETRLFLAGPAAPTLAACGQHGALEPVVLDAGVPAASALKMAYSAWTKGSGALLLAARAYAEASGVGEDLLAEWARSQPGLEQRCEATARNTAPKAWRFAGEMEQIAASLAGAGLPGGFHEAAAEVYDRMADRKDAPSTSAAEAIAALLRGT